MDIDLASQRVERISSEYVTILGLSGGAEIQAESGCRLLRPCAETVIVAPPDPAGPHDPINLLLGSTAESAAADESDGVLTVEFVGGVALEVPYDPDFEAWTVRSSDGAIVVSLPGGGVSHWGPSS